MKITVITGQTATGKTKLAVEKAQKENGELINADASQIYKGLDIVTGKDLEDVGDVPIHLISFLDPKENFSSTEWTKLVNQKIKEVIARNKTPIIIGGTYFYIAHFLYGVSTEGVRPDWELRRNLEKLTVSTLQNQLNELSPQIFNKLNQSDRSNPRRLIRKIELARFETEFENSVKEVRSLPYTGEFELIGLRFIDKEVQLRQIRNRVEKRIKDGAIEEVKELLSNGYEVTNPGLRANAVFEVAQYLHGEISMEQLKEKWITVEFQYSKRQYTFMKRDPNIKWIEV